VLAALVLGQLLLQEVHQGVAETLLLKIRAGDAGGIIPLGQVVNLADLRAVLTSGDGGRIAHGADGGLRRTGGGRHDHGQHQGHGK
jgi:hypothetical protein